jgi:hypothetical protein
VRQKRKGVRICLYSNDKSYFPANDDAPEAIRPAMVRVEMRLVKTLDL